MRLLVLLCVLAFAQPADARDDLRVTNKNGEDITHMFNISKDKPFTQKHNVSVSTKSGKKRVRVTKPNRKKKVVQTRKKKNYKMTHHKGLDLNQMNGQIDFTQVQKLVGDPKFQIQMQKALNKALPMVQKMKNNGQIEQMKAFGQLGAQGILGQ